MNAITERINDLNAKANTFKEQQGDKKVEVAEAPVWVPDSDIKACTGCRVYLD